MSYLDNTLFIIDEKAGYQGNIIGSMSQHPYVDYRTHKDGSPMTFEEYQQLPEHQGQDLILLPWANLEPLIKEYNRKTYTDKPAIKITKDDFWEMLEVLPPENWTRTGMIEHFRMMEYLTGTLTAQYARLGNEYITKTIDVCDKSTWITVDDFKQAIHKQ